ncbi:hypothetical protein XENTR_v10016471 [Xenopus tropicalis]|nr:hypothetical protein XENTR_v10016471 [Xenopus tropicalis]
MMPGETQAKPVGIASEAAGACQNCTALQQSLNEYVAALLGLKQRIIDSDHMLAEYQQKCDELQFSQRENDTLRCQLEQLLQKVSPQAQNQEDLKSLRAELEEKTSSLKIYQQTEIEYTRVKEECAKSNIVKKKLESKLKRMEEVSVKRFQDFKKLKMEKKELVKDLKKIQNKLKCFQNGKRTKATKNVHTQIANDEPVVSVDKRKIKLLLDELWGCIDSSPNKSQFHFQLLDKSGRRTRTQRDSDENKMTPNHSSPFTLNDMSAEPAELPVITGSNELKMSKGSKILEESVADCNGDSAFYEEKTADYLVSDLPGSYSLSSDHGTMASEFLEMINWARPLPPLLSPIAFSPSTSQKTLKSLKEEQEFVIKDKVDLGPSSINSEENMEPSCSGKFLNECVHSDNGQVQQSCEVTQTKAISESDANKKCRATSIKELEVSVVTSSQEQQEQPVSYNQPEKSCKAKNSVLDTPESMKTLERERSDDEQLALKSPNNKVSLFYHNASSTSISTIQTLSDEDGEHYQGETEETPDRRNTDKIEKTVDGSTNLLSMSLAAFEKSTKACKINSNKSHLINNSEQTFENTLKKQTNIKVSEEKNGSQDLVRIDSGSNPDNHIPKFKLSSSKHGQEHGHLLLNRKPAFFTESNIPPPKTEILKCIESLPEHSKIPSEQTKENITSSDRFLHSTDLHVKPANEVVTESYHQLLSKTSKLSLKDTDVMGTSLREINIKSLQAANLQEIQNSENKISEQSSVLSIFKMKEMYRSGYIDSDDSEDDFPVRKVNYAKFSSDNSAASANASLNLQNANKDTSELAADDSLDKCVDVEVKYNIKDNIIKPGTDINLISQNKITVDKVKENSIKLYHFESLKNPDHSISEGCRSLPDSLLLETKNFDSAKIQNDPFNNTNAVTFPTVEKELTLNDDQTDIGKGTSPFKEQEGQDISAISDVLSQMHNTEDQSAQNDDQAPGRSIVPGKNLIWNFERLDDFPDPRGKKYKKSSQKKPAKNIFANCNANAGSASKFLEGSNNPGNNLSGPETRKEKYSVSQRALSLNSQLGQTVLANADTSTKTQHSPETINKVRSEMGPPLPPLLGPLLATPPRTVRPLSPVMSSSSRSSLPSPLDDLISPLRVTPVPPVMSPVSDCRQYKSPMFTTPSPSEKGSRRILSSPLQFCAATPKHALPVPGRLPPSAAVNSAPTVQENSVKILDTMYPELSARARTLNILKGNVQLNRCIPGDSKPTVSQISGFKAITSTSTAFIKTGNNSKTSSNQDKQRDGGTNQSFSISASVNKRSSDCITMPKSAKRLRLDSESPVAANLKACFTAPSDKSPVTKEEAGYCDTDIEVASVHATAEDDVAKALKKVEELCFDLLPVIRSHIYVGTIPQIPVMRNEEKEVIYEFSSIKKGKVEDLLHAILKKLKTEKASLDGSVIQALCRVYTGLCRQIGDLERARVLSYCIFTEDFPEPDKMLLFIISSWNKVLSQNSVINRALQALLKQLAKDDVRICLSAYLNWEKSPPQNMRVILSSVMNGIQLCSELKFHQSEQFGEDLTDKMWEYIFAVNLMCCHRKWIWTHDNVISKELWPILDKWVKRKKGHVKNSFVTDIIVATVLRLVGCLCQMGLKEGFTAAVKNICAVIIAFIQHAQQEDMPWGVQLASVYMLCDVSPCDPQTIHKTLEDWRKAATNSIPPALTSALAEVASLTAIEN